MTVDPAALVAVVAMAAAYRRGVARVAARGRAWPVARSVAFGAGLVALTGAAFVPDEPFGAHAVQHLLMGMAAPPLLALVAVGVVVAQWMAAEERAT